MAEKRTGKLQQHSEEKGAEQAGQLCLISGGCFSREQVAAIRAPSRMVGCVKLPTLCGFGALYALRGFDYGRAMNTFPDDIFTEPASVDPDTLANLGPLRRLAGEWEGHRGVDLNPKAEGPERRDYIERIVFELIDPQANGPQLFYGLRYHIHINTPEEDVTFHDQVGHWLWEPATGLVLQTLSIPRGQVAVAAGRAKAGDDRLVLTADRGSTEYGICSTAFLEHAFRTDRYQIEVTFHADGTWSYVQETTLIVRGQAEPFIHRDRNRLSKIREAAPNPWMQILAVREAETRPIATK